MSELKQYQITASSAAELVRAIEAGVAAGELVPGERLPSVRRLAADVGLSPVTVASGLAELRRRGVVVTEQRRGSRIGVAPPISSARITLPVPSGARDLSSGNPDPALLPDLRAALERAKLPVRLYGGPAALGELVDFARGQLRADGIDAGSLCIVSGALDGIERVLGVNLRPGDAVAVENPGYAALYHLLRAQGLSLQPVAVDDRGMLPEALAEALERGARATVLTPRGQNPTGAALDGARAAALREVLLRFPRTLVIEDDHLGVLGGGTPLHSIAGSMQRWAATRSVAKALGPDLRLAVLCGDAATIARVEGRQQCGPGWVSHILQGLVLAMWSDPVVQMQVAAASDAYARRRERLLAHLGLRGVNAQGASGLNVWVPVEDEAAAVGALLQRGWVLAPGAPYRLGASRPAVRVTSATISEGEAEALAGDLAAVLAPGTATRSG